jgi:hypothetical protein
MAISQLDPPLPAGCGSTRDPEKTAGVPFRKPASRACRSPTTNFIGTEWLAQAGVRERLAFAKVQSAQIG